MLCLFPQLPCSPPTHLFPHSFTAAVPLPRSNLSPMKAASTGLPKSSLWPVERAHEASNKVCLQGGVPGPGGSSQQSVCGTLFLHHRACAHTHSVGGYAVISKSIWVHKTQSTEFSGVFLGSPGLPWTRLGCGGGRERAVGREEPCSKGRTHTTSAPHSSVKGTF